jgi:sulfur carrier protein
MKIQLNGEPREIPDHCTAAQLVALLELAGRRLAMEVNREIVPRTRYADTRLHDGDRVEIVHAIGGG